jgi:ribosome-binding protein aMBF1 (putative translation factor)
MILCDLCGKEKNCRSREIEGKEYDICSECWAPIAAKLKGKGRTPQETVFLPPPAIQTPEPTETKPVPGEPPKIVGRVVH